MAYVIRIQRYVSGRPAEVDNALYAAFIDPYADVHEPQSSYRRVRADDGALAAFCDWTDRDAGFVTEISVMRFGGALSVLDLMVELARRLDAVITASERPTMLVAERQRAEIPDDLRHEAVVISSGGEARRIIGYD